MAASNDGSVSEPGNDIILLERVFLRLGNADTDEQLEACVGKFLPPVLLKLASPHEQVRTKVMELLVHINKRVKCRPTVQLPLPPLLSMYQDEKATSFVINFAIIYITMGFPRLPKEQQLELMPDLFASIASRPQSHQDDILLLVMPMLGDLGNKTPSLDLKNRPQQSKILLRLALDLLLLPYGALPGSKEAGSEFPVPPGLSPQAYKKLTDKNNIDASQLELIKQSIVKFLNNDAVPDCDTLLPLIVAAADSRFSVANIATSALGRVASSVDWSNASTISPLYSLFLGGQQQRVPACTRIRLKLLHYLNRATGAAILYPHSIQVVFTSLFAQNTNPRLKTLALNFTMNIIQNGDMEQLKKVSPVVLGGLLKLSNIEEEWAHHAQAFTCVGRLVAKCPNAMSKRYEMLEELFNKMPGASSELRLAIREALLAMAGSFTVDPTLDSKQPDQPMEVDVAESTSMDVDESKNEEKKDEKDDKKEHKDHGTHIVTLLEKHLDSDDAMVRFVAARYASVLFSEDSVSSKFLLLLASGDNKDEVKVEALKALYGTARHTEIEDVVQNMDNTEVTHKGSPTFIAMVQYIWENISKRRGGSNNNHRFVVGNHVLPFSPATYYEILRYLRMCLNRNAGIKNGTPHPSSSSPILGNYLNKVFVESPESLNNYLSMVKILLSACPDIVPLSCLLDIVGCVPQKMSPQYVDQLSFFMNQFTNSTREEIRDTSALLYAVVMAHTADIKKIDESISDMISKCKSVKSLESQCGYMNTYCALLERTITLLKYKTSPALNDKNFKVESWQCYKEGVVYLAECLTNTQNLLISYACQNISLLAKCYSLPLPDKVDSEVSKTTETSEKSSIEISKHGLVEKLFSILKSAKYSSKIKERATMALGNLCVGEQYPFAKDIIKGFLDLAKETKDFEIHLEIGESLVLCVDGVNSIQNRDLWSQPPPDETTLNTSDPKAMAENDILLDWLLGELFTFVSTPHPNARQACCVWLLALVKNCSLRTPIKNKWSTIQEVFMEFLSENSDIVQDVASKGLSLVYQGCGEEERRGVVEKLVEQLAGGTRKVQQVTEDTKIFEEGQLGKTPHGTNLSTYKELCSLASDLNQPDLIYKFMHLANHNTVWNSKKGAAFGFQYIMQQAGAQLSEHLPKIVPRLYRYRFDPTPKIQNSMSSIWHALVPETQKTVEKYHKEILNDLVNNLTSNQWRVRSSCCQGLTDLLRTSKSLWDFLPRMEEIWTQLFRVMDDVHEGTRATASNTTSLLSKMCVTATDTQHPGSLSKEILTIILPVLMNQGITNTVAEVRHISLQTVSKLVSSNGSSLKPFMSQLVPGLLRAAGELESSKLSYMSAALGAQQQTQEAIDSVRAHAAKAHFTTETVTKCIQYIDAECLAQMLPHVLENLKQPLLGSKVAVCHCLGLLGLQLGKDLQPMSGKILSALVNTLLDRNPTVRKQCADTIGIIVGTAKDSSIDKLMQKLCTWYKERDEESVRSAIALTWYACSNRHSELLKERSAIVMPTLFIAMHAEKTPDNKSTVELYEEIWSDISPSKELGIRGNLQPICLCLKEGISSPSWSTKAQAARGIETVANEMKSGLGEQRVELLNILLEGLKGRSWQGKETLINSIAQLCRSCDGDGTLPKALVESVLESVMKECCKQEPLYKMKCLAALGDILEELKLDRFQEVYNILRDILDKNVGSVEKDSDDDEYSNEQSLKKKEQLISLKVVAYETLGKAWPNNIETQGKYQRIFAKHCSDHINMSTRNVQVSILTALNNFVEKLVLFNEPLQNSNEEELNIVLDSLLKVLDHSFGIQKHTRLRKEALNILSTVGKKLKDNKSENAFTKIKEIYLKYETELNSDTAPEIRSRLVQIKTLFQ